MIYIFIYLFFCVFGIFLGKYLRKNKKKLTWSSNVQTVMLVLLLFVMGAKLGSNTEVISKLGSIGFISIVLTVFVMLGSIVFVFIARKLLKIDREGESK